jgi:hypothetical protein
MFLGEIFGCTPKNLLKWDTTDFWFFFAVALVGIELATLTLPTRGRTTEPWGLFVANCLECDAAKWV